MKKLMVLSAGVCLAALSSQAAVTLATPFKDHMVLQRRTAVPVWGKADPGEVVKVAFGGRTVSATAGADGVFKPAFIINANNGAREKRMWQTCGMVAGTELHVVAPGVEHPKAIRYLYQKPWTGNVFADSGLPIAPMQLKAE